MGTEMSLGSAVALFVTLAAGGFALTSWLLSRHERRVREDAKLAGEAFDERRRRPDLDAMADRLGHPLPASYALLHADHELVRGEDWLIAVPNPVLGESECYVAWFEPADPETLSCAPKGRGDLLPIADNGLGDQFLIDPRQVDPDVIYYTHEDDGCAPIGVRLSEFVSAPRRPVPSE